VRDIEELEKDEAESLETSKFENWKVICSSVRERANYAGGLRLEEIPSRTLFLRKSEFPASKVTAAISLDGKRVELCWAVRERIGGLVEEQSATFQVLLDQNGKLYFRRNEEPFTVEELSQLIVSLADRF
jgi:hypothetical protein